MQKIQLFLFFRDRNYSRKRLFKIENFNFVAFVSFIGVQFFAELKTVKGRLSSLQEIQIKKLKALKQEVYVIYGMEGVRKFVEDFQNNCLSGTEYR